MKLQECFEQTLWEDTVDDVHYQLILNERRSNYGKHGRFDLQIKADSVGKVLSTRRNRDITYNPEVAAKAIRFGTDALDMYRRNKTITTRFVATDHLELRFYKKMIKALVSTGKYKLVRTKWIRNNKIWEIRSK